MSEQVNSSSPTTFGWIEVISGCMFSGKTEELLRRLRRAVIAHQRVKVFKPIQDTRYDTHAIVSHDREEMEATPVGKSEDILALASGFEVVAIDEAQFFDDKIVDVCVTLANQQKRVIIAGLDMDYRGKPFGPMPYLLAVAEYVTKLHAICQVDGCKAAFSHRLHQSKETFMLGTHEYEARCRYHFFKDQQENE